MRLGAPHEPRPRSGVALAPPVSLFDALVAAFLRAVKWSAASLVAEGVRTSATMTSQDQGMFSRLWMRAIQAS